MIGKLTLGKKIELGFAAGVTVFTVAKGSSLPPPIDDCVRFSTQKACETKGQPGCGWYLCAKTCRETGTDTSSVCPDWSRFPQNDSCREKSTIDTCNQAGCAWYDCTGMCFSKGTSQAWVCGGFVFENDLNR